MEHLVLDTHNTISQDSSDSLGDSTALACVRTLEIRGRPSYISHEYEVEFMETMKDVLPALAQEVLQSVIVTFEGSSSCFQHLLQSLASTPILASVQNAILGLSPKCVTFVTATTKRNLRSSLGLTEELLNQSFPALDGRLRLRDTVSGLGERSLASSVAGTSLTNLR